LPLVEFNDAGDARLLFENNCGLKLDDFYGEEDDINNFGNKFITKK